MSALEYKISVMQACLDGATIECHGDHGEWTTLANPPWNWVSFDYRIKPEPVTLWSVVGNDSRCQDSSFVWSSWSVEDDAYNAKAVCQRKNPEHGPYRIAKMQEVSE